MNKNLMVRNPFSAHNPLFGSQSSFSAQTPGLMDPIFLSSTNFTFTHKITPFSLKISNIN